MGVPPLVQSFWIPWFFLWGVLGPGPSALGSVWPEQELNSHCSHWVRPVPHESWTMSLHRSQGHRRSTKSQIRHYDVLPWHRSLISSLHCTIVIVTLASTKQIYSLLKIKYGSSYLLILIWMRGSWRAIHTVTVLKYEMSIKEKALDLLIIIYFTTTRKIKSSGFRSRYTGPSQ